MFCILLKTIINFIIFYSFFSRFNFDGNFDQCLHSIVRFNRLKHPNLNFGKVNGIETFDIKSASRAVDIEYFPVFFFL